MAAQQEPCWSDVGADAVVCAPALVASSKSPTTARFFMYQTPGVPSARRSLCTETFEFPPESGAEEGGFRLKMPPHRFSIRPAIHAKNVLTSTPTGNTGIFQIFPQSHSLAQP